jgi:hypothetical protein
MRAVERIDADIRDEAAQLVKDAEVVARNSYGEDAALAARIAERAKRILAALEEDSDPDG